MSKLSVLLESVRDGAHVRRVVASAEAELESELVYLLTVNLAGEAEPLCVVPFSPSDRWQRVVDEPPVELLEDDMADDGEEEAPKEIAGELRRLAARLDALLP